MKTVVVDVVDSVVVEETVTKNQQGLSMTALFFAFNIMNIKCHYCFETIPLEIFREEGDSQEFTLDCEVCCHPLHITAEWNEETETFDVEVEPE